MYEKIFKVRWDEKLGEGWMNIYNLELCLYSSNCVGGKALDNIKVVEVPQTKRPKICEKCKNRYECWTR